jgi:hypothetical protein
MPYSQSRAARNSSMSLSAGWNSFITEGVPAGAEL